MNCTYILIEINQFRTSSIDFVKLTAGHGVLYQILYNYEVAWLHLIQFSIISAW